MSRGLAGYSVWPVRAPFLSVMYLGRQAKPLANGGRLVNTGKVSTPLCLSSPGRFAVPTANGNEVGLICLRTSYPVHAAGAFRVIDAPSLVHGVAGSRRHEMRYALMAKVSPRLSSVCFWFELGLQQLR